MNRVLGGFFISSLFCCPAKNLTVVKEVNGSNKTARCLGLALHHEHRVGRPRAQERVYLYLLKIYYFDIMSINILPSDIYRGQKRMPDPLELELKTVLSCHVGPEN